MILTCLLILFLLISIYTKDTICIAVAVFFLLMLLIHILRKQWIVRKIRLMHPCEKQKLLCDLILPLGYDYEPCQDIFTTRIHSWQRSFGYGTVYDRAAPHFQMIFDALPVYFVYRGYTWLIEVWKGQYGINTGAELGIYRADTLIPEQDYTHHMFHAVTDDELLPMTLRLRKKGRVMAHMSRLHWWLTGFCMGIFSKPSELAVDASITFPDYEMLHAFVSGLSKYPAIRNSILIHKRTVSFTFAHSTCKDSPLPHRIYLGLKQWKNHLSCLFFIKITRPFTSSIDRVLYLYFYASFLFRKVLSIRYFRPSTPKKGSVR